MLSPSVSEVFDYALVPLPKTTDKRVEQMIGKSYFGADQNRGCER